MENQYKKAAEVLDVLYERMPADSFMSESIVRGKFNRFQKQFSADQLKQISGHDIWNKIYDLSGENSLLYMLSSSKSGYGEFGSISGGGVDFYPIYYAKEGGWSTQNERGNVRITYERAMEIGNVFRNKLINALQLIKHRRFDSIGDYEEFERELKRVIGKDAERVWIHKYFHMMYPDLFSELHSWNIKTQFLCALQIKPRNSFYGMAGQIAEIRRYMKMQDYYRIANVYYHFFPETGDGGICRLCLTAKGEQRICNWKPGEMEMMDPADFEDLLNISWFKRASEKRRNNMFVVTDYNNRLYGIFSHIEGEPERGKPLKTGRRGEWHPCFSKTDRLPFPEDGEKTKDKTFKKDENLILIYKRFYPYFDTDDVLVRLFEENNERFEQEKDILDSLRNSFSSQYPLQYQFLMRLKREQIIYGIAGSLLTRLYDDFKDYDVIPYPGLKDIGNIYYANKDIRFDDRTFSGVDSAFKHLQENLIRFLCIDSNSDEGILSNNLSEKLKIKLLSIYYPDKFLGISDRDELDYILLSLKIPYSEDDNWITKQRLLIAWKESHLPFAGRNTSNYVFLKTICNRLDIPFPNVEEAAFGTKNKTHEADQSPISNSQPKNSGKTSTVPEDDKKEAIQKEFDSSDASESGMDSRQELNGKKQTVLEPVADPQTINLNEIEESIEQLAIAEQPINDISGFSYSGIPQEKKEFTETEVRKGVPRDIQRKKNALAHANYKCEFDENHKSFISKVTGLPYMEAHHLIPMEYYNKFDVSIDVEENIVSLCSNCHREIHHGKDAYKIVRKLFDQRKQYLERAGIKISLRQLLVWYGVDDIDNTCFME